MGAEGVSSRLARTRQRPCCCLGATGATSSLATQQQPCARGRRRDCASPGPDTHPWAQGIWHLSAFSPQNTGSPLPASLSLAKAISDSARFGICGLLTFLWILLSAWLSSGPVSPRTSQSSTRGSASPIPYQLTPTLPLHFQVSPCSTGTPGAVPGPTAWLWCCSDVPSPWGCLAAATRDVWGLTGQD